ETPIMKIDAAIEKQQVTRLAEFKAARNHDEVAACLARISSAAEGTENLMPLVIDAVEKHCTLGEIAHCLRNVWGEYKG
ncbi:MAG TPA: methylmalonyl-CoA mutase family protein, partial [Chitinophagaceae bacterium]|nr:methylmalonyl-CoA mutase family protein [Chitinophagaceae bacterium]